MQSAIILSSAVFLAVAFDTAAAQTKYSCTPSALRSGNHTILNSTSGHGIVRFEHIRNEPGHCLHAVMRGQVRIADDLRDVTAIGNDGRFTLHELTRGSERRLEIRGEGRGVARTYLVNGQPSEYDAGARRWLEETLTMLVRGSGFDAERRVASLRARGGTAAVLQEITHLRSDGVRRKYYTALLDDGSLGAADRERVLLQASRDIDSDGDLRAVFTRGVSRGGPLSPRALEALGERIDSDGDKSAVLIAAVPGALEADAATQRAFFTAVTRIDSDGDRRRVLSAALRATTSIPVVDQIIRAAETMESDGDKSAVLVSIARTRMPQQNERLLETYLRVARTIDSEGDYRRAVEAVLR